MLTGERPEVNPEVAERLRAWGHDDFISYVVWACERALERGLLPHTNLGVLEPRGPRPAARGDRLAGADARVDQSRPGDGPRRARRPSTRRGGWRRSRPPASCGSRSRAGSSSASARREEERVASLEALAEVHERHGHIQEVILQNFVPHPRYYGREVAEIADEAAAASAGAGDGSPLGRRGADARVGVPVTLDDMKRLIAETPPPDARRRRPDPAEPLRLVGRAGRGRRDRSRRALRQRRPHLARARRSRARTRSASGWRRRATRSPSGCASTRSTWTRSGWSRASSTWSSSSTGASSRARARAGAASRPIDPELAPRGDREGRGGRRRSSEEELTALFAETRPEVIEEMRAAADELRAELAGETATFVVNRNINFTNVCVVGCAFCGFGQGKRSPDAYHVTEDDFAAAGQRGGRLRRHRDLHAGRDPPRLHARALRALAAAGEGGGARRSTCTPTRRWRSTSCASAPGKSARGGLRLPARVRARARRPGTAAEVLHDGVRAADLAEQAAGRPLGRDHRGLPPRRPALDLDGDVRPHRGAARSSPATCG